MPVKNGLDATVELRERDFRVPIVALTANALPSDRDKCLAAKMNEVLTKPFVRCLLFDTIKRFVPQFNPK